MFMMLDCLDDELASWALVAFAGYHFLSGPIDHYIMTSPLGYVINYFH